MKSLTQAVILFILMPVAGISQVHTSHKPVYHQVPKIFLVRDSLIRFIKPDSSYTYWEFDYGTMDTTKDGPIIFSTGIKPAGINFKDPFGSMLMGCLPSFCYRYIAYIRNGKAGYITTNEGLKSFIGSIDNIPEAMLFIELTDDALPDSDKRGGSYRQIANGFELILTHYILCPYKKEAVRFSISHDGVIKKFKLGAYFKSIDCYSI